MDNIISPHGRYFRESFARVEIARDFLRHNRPATLLPELDLATLEISTDTDVSELVKNLPAVARASPGVPLLRSGSDQGKEREPENRGAERAYVTRFSALCEAAACVRECGQSVGEFLHKRSVVPDGRLAGPMRVRHPGVPAPATEPATMDHDAVNPVIALQLAHRSIRRYTPEPLPDGLLEILIRAGQHAASSSFIQAYSVVRVTRLESRAALARAAGGQVWIEQAAEFLVFCADLRQVDAACRAQDAGALEGWTEHGLAAAVDTALMAQNVLLAAESVGLGGVFIGGIRNDPETVARVLGLPDLVAPLFGLCLGWPEESPQIKPRKPRELVLHEDVYRDPDPQSLADYDQTMAAYYAHRTGNSRAGDWSGNTARAVQGKKREHMRVFLAARGLFRR